MLSNNLYVLDMYLGNIPGESTASTTVQWFGVMPSSDSGFQPTPQIYANSCSGNNLVMDPSAHIHHMNDVIVHGYVHSRFGTIPGGSGASKTAQQYGLFSSSNQ